jgi:hypothetical protein
MSESSEIRDFHNIKFLKYPVPRLEYTYKTGSIAERLVSDILRDEGIEVEPHNVNENGVDIRAKDVDIGIEVWNWCRPHEYNSRIQSIIENLKHYPFRALVTSFISKDVKDYIESTYIMSPIFIVELGFQILPKEWKHFYKNEKNIIFYPSREAYVKVRQRMKPLIDAIKRVRRDKILARYFPSYDYGDMVILDASGCTNEEFNNFLRDLKEHKEKVTLITVQDPSVESPSKKLLSTKEGFNAYVYRSSINSKNICENNSSKNRETGNRRARIEEDIQSSTFKFKLRTKLGKISRFVSNTLNLLRSLWHDKCGSITLAHWIPVKLKTKNKTNRTRSQKIFSCPFRIILVCPYYRQFYACLIQIIDEYTSRVEKYGYNEEQIEKLVDRTILRHTWKSKNQILGKCRCKPISFIDDEITTRKPRNGIAVTEPCKKMRCSQLIKSNRCEWMELLLEHRSKPKQFKLEEFMNGDDEHG